MLVLFSMAFFVVPLADEAQAQSGRSLEICFNTNTSAATLPATNNACPTESGWTRSSVLRIGYCVRRNATTNEYSPVEPYLDPETGYPLIKNKTIGPSNPAVSGDQCVNSSGEDWGTFKTLPTSQYTPPGTNTNTNTNSNSNTGGNTNTGSGNSNTGNNGNTGGPSGGNPGNTSQGTCDDGFHQKGPLCIPDNPFKPGSLANTETTPAAVATLIIKWMLYFAAIVAVIMAIIGGYQVMTAQGNASQALSGRKTLTNALIGLAITLLSYLIVQVVVNFLTK